MTHKFFPSSRLPVSLHAALLVAFALTAFACGAGTPGRAPPERAQVTDVRAPLTRRARLHYELGGRPFPLPLVSGTIGGRAALMVVDTGANSHVIAGWFARKAALPMTRLGDLGSDHAGRSIATYRVDSPDIVIEGWGKVDAKSVLATELPDAIARLGIAAFISPQRLDEEGDATVMDLANGELRSAWWDAESRELAGVDLVRAEDARACVDEDGPARGLAFVVPTKIDAHEAELLVDTGAQRSDVFASSTAGSRLVPRSAARDERMVTASGRITSRVAKGARLAAGAFATTLDVDLIQGVADGACPRDGVLAMDVLRSCTLLLGRTRMQARCAPPR